jgi:hypothetical protein
MPSLFCSELELVDVSSRYFFDEEISHQWEHMVGNVALVHSYTGRLLVLPRELPQIPLAEIRHTEPLTVAGS